jgi:hypothetical protein
MEVPRFWRTNQERLRLGIPQRPDYRKIPHIKKPEQPITNQGEIYPINKFSQKITLSTEH